MHARWKPNESSGMAKAERERHPVLAFREDGATKPGRKKTRDEVEMDWVNVVKSQTFKTVFLGDSNVGKTCLVRLFVEQRVVEHSTNTIGFDHHCKEVELDDTMSVKLQIWDTAGMEQFRNALITKYYRDANGVVFVYDITRMDSFESIESWLAEVKQYCGLERLQMALVGNKLDQASQRKVAKEMGQRLAEKHGMLFLEISAVQMENLSKLEELFVSLAKQMLSQREKEDFTMSRSVIRLGGPSDDWVIVNAPTEPIPRGSYRHQQRAKQVSKCVC